MIWSKNMSWTAAEWPIAANMLGFGNVAPDGEHIRDAPPKVWASQLRQLKELGIDTIDPTDAWVPLAQLSEQRLADFEAVLADLDMKVASISMTRSSVVDTREGEQNFADALRFIELAPRFGATIVNMGFMQALTPAQAAATWFWLEPGHTDDPALREAAITKVRELGDAAQSNGIQLSLEMYEDTYIGTADEAVSFVVDVAHDAVGLNPDIGNLVRLHRPIENPLEMLEKVLPYSNFWHIKNYTRDFDPATGAYSSAPMPLKYGYVNYRTVIRRAIELGFEGPFCCEHYGSDSFGVIAENREYVRQVLTSVLPA